MTGLSNSFFVKYFLLLNIILLLEVVLVLKSVIVMIVLCQFYYWL